MAITRREFVRNGVVGVPFSFGAPAFISYLARAKDCPRNLVVLYLSAVTTR